MAKTLTNSRPCSCCGRLLPKKTTKRKTCGTKCTRAIQKAQKVAP